MPEARATALRATAVTKRFFDVPVLRAVDLALVGGEIHCLVGENGSGKSTLVKILSGVLHGDDGSIEGPRGGEAVAAARMTPAAAAQLGIHTVHQEATIFQSFSVAENLMLGRGYPRTAAGRIDRAAMHRHAEAVLERFAVPARPGTTVDSLSPPVRSMIAIARALQDSETSSDGILILDEPTASLSESDSETLFSALRGYAAAGQAILVVTHRLEEVLRFSSRVSVLRDGLLVASQPRAELDRHELVRLIVGRERVAEVSSQTASTPPAQGDPVLELSEVGVGPLAGIDLTLRSGEIVGLAGIEGCGAAELLETVYGTRERRSGALRLAGTPIATPSPAESMRRGVAFIPPERADAAFSPLSVRENLVVTVLRSFWRWGRMSRPAEAGRAGELVARFRVQPPNPAARMSSLSGGNQQKVILARWLQREPRLLLLHEPTHGVDVGARAQIHETILAAAARGAAALLVTSDLGELLRLSHRVMVLAGGRVVAEAAPRDIDRRELVHLIHGRPVEAQEDAS